MTNISAEQLRSIVERLERLNGDKDNVAEHIRAVYAEAKSNGYDAKALREIVKLRKMDAHERDEKEFTLDVYKKALGMQTAMDFEGGL